MKRLAIRSAVSPGALVLLFLALALPLGLAMVRLVPLGQVADEPAQALRADSLLQGEWIGHRAMVPSLGDRRPREGVDADRALLEAVVLPERPLVTTATQIRGSALVRASAIRFGQVGFAELGNIAGYCPLFYVPAAVAIGIAKTLHLGAAAGFMGARLANLLTALAMAAASLLLARRGAAALLAVLLLPTSMGLMASVSQDGLLIAASALAAALATRLDAEVAAWRQPAFVGSALLVGAVCLAKPPYLPMTALLLLPLHRVRRNELLGRVAAIGLILLLVVVWTAANVHYAAAPVYRLPEAAGPLWPKRHPAVFDATDMGAQLHVLFARPWRLVWLPLRSMTLHPAIFRQMVDVLGWLNLMLPGWLVALWTAALVLAFAGTAAWPGGRASFAPALGEAGLLALAIFVAVLLIYLSQYLSFTPVGWDWISGPQGRYLLPLLPMLVLALRPSAGIATPGWLSVAPAAIAGVGSLWGVPATVVGFYYAGG